MAVNPGWLEDLGKVTAKRLSKKDESLCCHICKILKHGLSAAISRQAERAAEARLHCTDLKDCCSHPKEIILPTIREYHPDIITRDTATVSQIPFLQGEDKIDM